MISFILEIASVQLLTIPTAVSHAFSLPLPDSEGDQLSRTRNMARLDRSAQARAVSPKACCTRKYCLHLLRELSRILDLWSEDAGHRISMLVSTFLFNAGTRRPLFVILLPLYIVIVSVVVRNSCFRLDAKFMVLGPPSGNMISL
jgi:hypothetical protein